MHQNILKTTQLDCEGPIPPSVIFFRDFCSEIIFYSFLLCIEYRNLFFHLYVPDCCISLSTIRFLLCAMFIKK